MNERKKRVIYLDILRVIAIFTVFFIHTGDVGMHYYLNTSGRVEYWIGMFIATASQCCVPLFFMVTGALLLKRDEGIRYVLLHRVLRMVIVVVLLSVFQYILKFRYNEWDDPTLADFFYWLYSGTIQPQNWFLYAYISMMLILPFLQRLVKAIPRKEWFYYLFSAHILLNGVLLIVEYFFGWTRTPLDLPMFEANVVYAVAGYYVEHISEDTFEKGRNVLSLNLIAFGLLLLETCLNHVATQSGRIMAFGGEFPLITAMALFVTARYLCAKVKVSSAAQKIISFMGVGTFGCYLIDEQLRGVCYPVFEALLPRIGTYPAVFVWITLSLCVGIILSNAVKKIPLLGRLL